MEGKPSGAVHDSQAAVVCSPQVLAVSAALTDRQKMTAEFYDDKLSSLATIPIILTFVNGWNIHTMLGAVLSFTAIYDATVVAWKEKMRHAAVRPASLVRYFYGDSSIKAYAGR